MLYCPTCRKERQGKVCFECGSNLVRKCKAIQCTSCGCLFENEVKFCPECGNKIAKIPSGETIDSVRIDKKCCRACQHEHKDEHWKYCVLCGEMNPFFPDDTARKQVENDSSTREAHDTHRETMTFPRYRCLEAEDSQTFFDLANRRDLWAMLELSQRHHEGMLVREDAIEAKKLRDAVYNEVLKYADLPYPDVMLCLGRCLILDISDEKEREKGAKYIMQAAMNGHLGAMRWYAYVLEHGIGVPEDKEKSVQWYKKAADLGCYVSQCHYALALLENDTIEENIDVATELLTQSASNNYSLAQYILGTMHISAIDSEPDVQKGIYHLFHAAKNNHLQAQTDLGWFYLTSDTFQRPSEGIKWLKRAAEQDFHEAQFLLGRAYIEGIGVKKDVTTGLEWLTIAAEAGDADAQLTLGIYYAKGTVVPHSFDLALKWLEKAADQGEYEAMFYIGEIYSDEDYHGFNWKKALQWFKIGAENGDRFCQRHLGLCYEFGRGVEINITTAIYWYHEADKQGDGFASFRLGFYYAQHDNIDSAKLHLRKALEQETMVALPLYSFIDVLKNVDFYWDGGLGSLYFNGVNMNYEKLNNAKSAYGSHFDKSEVMLLYDDTFWGSGKDGFVILSDFTVITSKNPAQRKSMLDISPQSDLDTFFGVYCTTNIKKGLLNMVQNYKKYFLRIS